MGPWLLLQEWRPKNSETGSETGGQLPILHSMPSARQGTERHGPTAHLQGVLGWHIENLITIGMSASKSTGSAGDPFSLGLSEASPQGVTAKLKATMLGQRQAKLESALEGGSDQSLGQEGLGPHLSPMPRAGTNSSFSIISSST